jgi:transcriptional/translational regulatory protein YebC/TACO1
LAKFAVRSPKTAGQWPIMARFLGSSNTSARSEAGAEDINVEEEGITILTAMEDLHKVNDALIKAGYTTNEVGLTYIATNKTELSRADMLKLIKLLDVLDDLEDVQETYINVDIPEDVYEEA